MYENNYLAHHGVKGMKWGVRHDKKRLGRKFNKLSKNYEASKILADQQREFVNRRKAKGRGTRIAEWELRSYEKANKKYVEKGKKILSEAERKGYSMSAIKDSTEYLYGSFYFKNLKYDKVAFHSELYHYGVKGMKWGVRHDKSTHGYSRKKVNKKKVAAFIASPTLYGANGLRKKYKAAREKKFENSHYAKAKGMSDEELRSVVNRINLEQSYVNAMQRDQASAKQASQLVLEKHGGEALSYISSIPKNKKFKEKVAKKAAVAFL